MEVTQQQEGLTFDELSLQESSSFLAALQELKNLRPQLYFAAEYFEDSYLQNPQKRKVLETSKDYVVDALVNAIDHLGNVASKLNDLIIKECAEVSSTELRICCLKQRALSCREHIDADARRHYHLVQAIPRFHKHYILPERTDFEGGAQTGLYVGTKEVSSDTSSSPQTMSASGTVTNFSSTGWKDILEGKMTSGSLVKSHKPISYQNSQRGKRFLSSFLSRRRFSK